MFVSAVETKVVVSTAAVFCLASNPNRHAVSFSNNSVSDIWLSKAAAALAQGIILKAGGGSYTDDREGRDGLIFTGVYTAIAVTAGTNNLAVCEESYEL